MLKERTIYNLRLIFHSPVAELASKITCSRWSVCCVNLTSAGHWYLVSSKQPSTNFQKSSELHCYCRSPVRLTKCLSKSELLLWLCIRSSRIFPICFRGHLIEVIYRRNCIPVTQHSIQSCPELINIPGTLWSFRLASRSLLQDSCQCIHHKNGLHRIQKRFR